MGKILIKYNIFQDYIKLNTFSIANIDYVASVQIIQNFNNFYMINSQLSGPPPPHLPFGRMHPDILLNFSTKLNST